MIIDYMAASFQPSLKFCSISVFSSLNFLFLVFFCWRFIFAFVEMNSQFKVLGESLIPSLQAADLNSPIYMH